MLFISGGKFIVKHLAAAVWILGGFLTMGSAAVAQGAPPAEAESMHTVGIAILGVALSVIGYLLNRGIRQNDDSIRAMDSKLDRVLDLFAQLDKATSTEQARVNGELALIRQSVEGHDAELSSVRRELHGVKVG